MILTYKVKHNRDFLEEFQKGWEVISYLSENPQCRSSKDVKHIGLKSVISNQILRKYGSNKTLKSVKSLKLPITNQGISFRSETSEIWIPCLKLTLPFKYVDFEKINYIEIGEEYAYIVCTVPEGTPINPIKTIGVDLNATGHIVVASCPETGEVWKFGKKAPHTRKKYQSMRRKISSVESKKKHPKWRKLKTLKHREQNICVDINHQISSKLVKLASERNAEIVFEDLKQIREKTNKKNRFNKTSRRTVNSWSFYQLRQFVEYKSTCAGVPVRFINPYMTSQKCSRCGEIGIREGKSFTCPHCGHVDHADVNAAFNIALTKPADQSIAE